MAIDWRLLFGDKPQMADLPGAALGGLQIAQRRKEDADRQANVGIENIANGFATMLGSQPTEMDKQKLELEKLNVQKAQQGLESGNFDLELKKHETLANLAGSASDPATYQSALTKANKMGIDTSSAPTTWDNGGKDFVKSVYQNSNTYMNQLRAQKLEREANAPYSNTGRVNADLQSGKITEDQAKQVLGGRQTTVYDPATGNPIVQMGGNQQQQQGMTPGGATELQKQDIKQIAAARKAAEDASNEISSLPALRQSLQNYGRTGSGATALQMGNKALSAVGLGNQEKAGAGDFIESESSKIALFNRKNMPGSMSDSDRKFLVDMAPGLNKTPEGNKLILDQTEATAKRMVQRADFKEQYRLQNGSLNGESSSWKRYIDENPIVTANKNGQVQSIQVPEVPFDNYLSKQQQATAQQPQQTEKPVNQYIDTNSGSAIPDSVFKAIRSRPDNAKLPDEEFFKKYNISNKPQSNNSAGSALNGLPQFASNEYTPAGGSITDVGGTSPAMVASNFLGSNEKQDNKVLSKYFEQSMGQKINPQDTPWCAAFANSVLKSSGYKGTDSLAARSFLKWGEPTNKPSIGDIVVLDRGKGMGHVGFYAGKDRDGNIQILGGNQDDSVSVKSFSPSKLLGYRKPPTANDLQSIGSSERAMPGVGSVEQPQPPTESKTNTFHPDVVKTASAIAQIETQGAKNPYRITTDAGKGRTALGKYQILESNLKDWGKAALGRPVTRREFMTNPEVQDKIAMHQINTLRDQGHDPQNIASIWLSGRPMKGNKSKDKFGTSVPAYINKFNKYFDNSNQG